MCVSRWRQWLFGPVRWRAGRSLVEGGRNDRPVVEQFGANGERRRGGAEDAGRQAVGGHYAHTGERAGTGEEGEWYFVSVAMNECTVVCVS